MTRCLSCMEMFENNSNICPICGYVQNTPPREAYHLNPGIVLNERYLVGRVLGYGGFGVTYIGFDAKLERKIAIKEFLPTTFATRLPGDTHLTVYNSNNANEQFGAGLNRFVQEAQTLAQFNGIPGVVDIYDTFVGNNTGYIVMQYLKGSDVKNIIASQGLMQYEMARDIILSICDTLMPIHAQNIIHRDISPDNIYITEMGEIKLLDFGAARYESAVNSKSLSVILKSGYAPEEQYRSKGEQGPWTDVYALAATFYKMLTGQTPPDSMERAIRDEIIEPSKFGVALPPSAENALMNALNVNVSDRTKSIYEFKMSLINDGTQRVVVKTKKESAKVPLGAKITIGLCSVLLGALGIYAANGGFTSDEEPETIVVGGTQLEDIKATEEEGITSVPDFTGMTMPEAETAAEEAGLTIVIDRKFITNDVIDEAVIFDQEITPGESIEEGSVINILLHVGDPINAIARGDIEDVYGMDPRDAAEYLDDYKNVMTAEDYEREDGPMFKNYENREEIYGSDPFNTFMYNPNYIEVPSSPEEAGKVISIEQFDETSGIVGNYYFTVGTGTQEHIYGSFNNAQFIYDEQWQNYCISVLIEGNEDDSALFEYAVMVSLDGGTTYEEMSRLDGYLYENEDIAMHVNASNKGFYNEEYIGKEMIVKVDRYLSSTGMLLDSYVLEKPFLITQHLSEITVNDVQKLSFEDGKNLAASGDISFVYDSVFGNNSVFDLSQEDFELYYQTYKITGNFVAGVAYNVNLIYSGLFIECKTDGELYFVSNSEYGAFTSIELDEIADEVDISGDVIKYALHKPYFFENE